MRPHIGVCSWSLRPGSVAELVDGLRAVGVTRVQLALDPIRRGEWTERTTRETLAAAGITIASGMMGMNGEDYSTLESIRRTGGVRPGETWNANVTAARANAEIAARLGISLVTFHAGFLPENPRDTEREAMMLRLSEMCRVFANAGVRTAFETGQESAVTLSGVLDDLVERVGLIAPGVNFDPANMILYAMGDPVESLRTLAPRVLQIHIKDAVPTQKRGTWGREVVAGTGNVDWRAFFDVYRTAGLRCDCVIEREAGPTRIEDIIAARRLIESHFPREAGAS